MYLCIYVCENWIYFRVFVKENILSDILLYRFPIDTSTGNAQIYIYIYVTASREVLALLVKFWVHVVHGEKLFYIIVNNDLQYHIAYESPNHARRRIRQTWWILPIVKKTPGTIASFHDSVLRLVRCDAVWWCGRIPTFQKTLPPSAQWSWTNQRWYSIILLHCFTSHKTTTSIFIVFKIRNLGWLHNVWILDSEKHHGTLNIWILIFRIIFP
jgi:hypothetical protein